MQLSICCSKPVPVCRKGQEGKLWTASPLLIKHSIYVLLISFCSRDIHVGLYHWLLHIQGRVQNVSWAQPVLIFSVFVMSLLNALLYFECISHLCSWNLKMSCISDTVSNEGKCQQAHNIDLHCQQLYSIVLTGYDNSIDCLVHILMLICLWFNVNIHVLY